MTLAQARSADLWADTAYTDVARLDRDRVELPIDLNAIARQRRVKRVKLRPMVRLGALVPVLGGFEILLQSQEPHELDVETPEPKENLHPRQRFTLAHEIAHTLFYRNFAGVPVPTGKVKTYGDPDKIGLENICDRAAKRLLVPTRVLKREIEERLGDDCRRIDAPFVRSMVGAFRASYEVILERLRATEPDNVFPRCILLVRKKRGDYQVRTWYIGMGLLAALPPLEKFTPVAKWFPAFPPSALQDEGGGEWQVAWKGRTLLVQRFPLRTGGDFLLQFDDLADTAPISKYSW